MKKSFLFTTIALLAAFSVSTGYADDKKKDKDKDKDRDVVILVDRDGRHYFVDRDGKRHWVDDKDHNQDRSRDDRDGRRDNGGAPQDRPRTIFVIERDRPVERTVYVDRDGRYYRWEDGRRIYVVERHYDSYPSKYYYPDGRRRVTITLPF